MFIALSLALIAVSALASATVTPAAHKMRVHEYRAHPPDGFVPVAKALPDTHLTMRLGLKQRDTTGLIEALYRVSDPVSADYGKHLSQEEVAAFTGPTPDTLTAVTSWLTDNGVSSAPVSVAGDWLEFTLPAAAADALFDANFTVFEHSANRGSHSIRTLKYSLPAALQPHIDVLLPGISFWNPENTRGAPMFTQVEAFGNLTKRQGGCSNVTPACLQSLYGIPTAPAPRSSNVLAVSGYLNQFANQADLTLFLGALRPDIANGTFSTQLIDGGANSQNPVDAGIEANLDVQYTVGIATGVPVTFISVGPNTQDGLFGFLDIINFHSSQVPNQPKVLTTSYNAYEFAISTAAFQRLCTAYATLGAQGTSIIFSTGDGGVAGINPNQPCSSFLPTYPSGCPFLTTVGATTFGSPEVAAGLSSGGFSNVFPAPDYQLSAIATYKAQIGNLFSGRYNIAGRGFPDVSAVGERYIIAVNGKSTVVSGTSASAPVFASVVSLINSRLLAQGKPALGFLNPFLYAHPEAFNDITSGSNPGCGTPGFPAKAGWDPVTGLGTPKFSALAAAAGV